jgi:hypothetical protein
MRLKGRHATWRIRTTRAKLHRLPRSPPLPLPAAQHKKDSESVPFERIYAEILPTSVRQRTQPCFNGRLHIGESAVAAAGQSTQSIRSALRAALQLRQRSRWVPETPCATARGYPTRRRSNPLPAASAVHRAQGLSAVRSTALCTPYLPLRAIAHARGPLFQCNQPHAARGTADNRCAIPDKGAGR